MEAPKQGSSPTMPTHSDAILFRILHFASLLERTWIRTLDPYGLLPVEFEVLFACKDMQQPTATDIAAMTTIEASSISRVVQRLFNKGLLARRRSQADRRVVYLRLTDAGIEIIEQIQEPLRELGDMISDDIGSEEIAGFVAAIARASAGLESLE